MPGVTAGGDGAEPVATRPHRELLLAGMVLVLLISGLVYRLVFTPSGSDSDARAAAAESGLVIADDVQVRAINGGFRLAWETDVAGVNFGGFFFDVVEREPASALADRGTWEPQIEGATAYAEGSPPLRVLIDASGRSWIATPGTPWIYSGDKNAMAAWDALAGAISFTSK